MSTSTLINYLENCKQVLGIDICSSRTLDVTIRVLHGLLVGPLLFCIFISDLPEALFFSEPFIFADALRKISTKTSYWVTENDLDMIEKRVRKKTIELAMDLFWKLTFRGSDRNIVMMDQNLNHSKSVKDLSILALDDQTWKKRQRAIEECQQSEIPSQKRCSESIVTCETKTVQLSPLVSHVEGFLMCPHIKSRSPTSKFSKKKVRCRAGNKTTSFRCHQRILKTLPLPMFLQLNDILQLS